MNNMLQNSAKNKTGTFLGTESMTEQRDGIITQKSLPVPKIGPLHAGRGRSLKTSTEASRYRKVQEIRQKESYKGFNGLTLKAAQRPKTSPAACHYARVLQRRNGGANDDILQLTKPNPRRFTAVTNHGVTHREYLTYTSNEKEGADFDTLPVNLATSLAQTASMEGPTQYYNSLCGSNPEALKTLLTNKKFGWPTNQYTGFHIRSYRKPPTAQLLANLDSYNSGALLYKRPKTAATALSPKELLVPQPYIYRSSANAAKRVVFKSANPVTTVIQSQSDPIVFSEVTGLQFKLKATDLVTMSSVGGGSASPSAGRISSDDVIDMYGTDKGQPRNSPETSSPEQITDTAPPSNNEGDDNVTQNLIGRFDKALPIMKKNLDILDPKTMSTNERNITPADPGDNKAPVTQQINIAIVTDDGNHQPPEIDETEEDRNNRSPDDGHDSVTQQTSISDRIQKIKLGEDAANFIKIEAEERKKLLENLLEEHETLVKQISADNSKQISLSH